MKLSLTILFLAILLLCGVLLHAANSDRKLMKIQKVKQETTSVQLANDMHLLPNVILL